MSFVIKIIVNHPASCPDSMVSENKVSGPLYRGSGNLSLNKQHNKATQQINSLFKVTKNSPVTG